MPMRNDDSTTYCLGLLVEEMGEALAEAGRALRFGLDTPTYPATLGMAGANARDILEKELGDVLGAVAFAAKHRVVRVEQVDRFADVKLAKLQDGRRRDNMGRRLAPEADSAERRND